jgi:hypothetical protein
LEGQDSSQKKYSSILLSEPSARLFFETLDLKWVEPLIRAKYPKKRGRPPLPYAAQFRAHFFKDLRQIKSFRKLAKVLHENDDFWAHYLGFERAPHHDSFSAFRKRVGSELYRRVFEGIRDRLREELRRQGRPELGGEEIAVDSTPVKAYSRPARGGKEPSDKDARWGFTVDKQTGKKTRFFGHKLHTALDVNYGTPIEYVVTPGNCSDSPQYPKLLNRVREAGIPFKVVAADAGYDARRNYIVTLKNFADPIIAFNRRRKPKGTKGRRFDQILHIKRDSEEWKEYYRRRTAVERQFSELKEQLGLTTLTLRGLEGAIIHFTISLTVLVAINLVAHLTGNPELLRSIEPWRYL